MRIVPFFVTIFATALLVLSLTAGCAQVAWEKAGADAVSAGNDLESCRREARLHAYRLRANRDNAVPTRTLEAHRPAPTIHAPSDAAARDTQAEQEWAARCMRQKGYELVRLH